MIFSCHTALSSRVLCFMRSLSTLSSTSGKQRTSTARKLFGILRIVSVVVESEHTTCVCNVRRHTCDALYLSAKAVFIAVVV